LGDCWDGQEKEEDQRINGMLFLESHAETLTMIGTEVTARISQLVLHTGSRIWNETHNCTLLVL
jgi:hypothetical protein